MKTQRIISRSGFSLILIVILLFSNSCKKDDTNDNVTPSTPQRVVQILEKEGGMEEYKEEFVYKEEKLLEDNYFLFEDGEWKDWINYKYEYPSSDKILQIGLSNKYEKTFDGENIVEFVYSRKEDGIWGPKRKLEFDYQYDLLKERRTYYYLNNSWELKYVTKCQYSGDRWIRNIAIGDNGLNWDTIARLYGTYESGKLIEVNGYLYYGIGNWKHSEQYIIQYESGRISKMILNDINNDIVHWDYSILIKYNKYGNPLKYTLEYDDYPDEVLYVTYENKVGNFRKANAINSGYDLYPWMPTPVKSSLIELNQQEEICVYY